jgi:hypothetical protein
LLHLLLLMATTGRWGRVGLIRLIVEEVPIRRVATLDIEGPITDAKLLVEGGAIGADVRYAPTVFVAHVEDVTVELCVSVEAH